MLFLFDTKLTYFILHELATSIGTLVCLKLKQQQQQQQQQQQHIHR